MFLPLILLLLSLFSTSAADQCNGVDLGSEPVPDRLHDVSGSEGIMDEVALRVTRPSQSTTIPLQFAQPNSLTSSLTTEMLRVNSTNGTVTVLPARTCTKIVCTSSGWILSYVKYGQPQNISINAASCLQEGEGQCDELSTMCLDVPYTITNITYATTDAAPMCYSGIAVYQEADDNEIVMSATSNETTLNCTGGKWMLTLDSNSTAVQVTAAVCVEYVEQDCDT